MARAHIAAVLLLILALGVTNLVFVLHETNKHHVDVEHHPTFRPLFVRSTRMLPAAGGVCGVGWVYRADEDRCVRDLARGVDVRYVLEEADACLDFYTSSCGTFNADPANSKEASLFSYVQRLNTEQIEELISAQVANETRVNVFHRSCTQRPSSKSEELAASKTLRALLAAVGMSTVSTYDDLAALWGYLQRYDTPLPLEMSLELDPWRPARLVPSLRWSGAVVAENVSAVAARLSLIYPPATARSWAEYIALIERDLVGIMDGEQETNFLAYLRRGRVDFVDDWLPSLSGARFNISRFVAACAPEGVSVGEWMAALAERPLWTTARGYMSRLPEVIERYTLETWLVYTKHAILYHLYNEGAPKLAFHRLYDAQHALPWTRYRPPTSTVNASCVQLTQAFMPHAIDRLYAARFFSEETRVRAGQVAEEVRAHFVERLAREGLGVLAAKVNAMRLDVGIPEDSQFSSQALKEDAVYVDNVLQMRRYHIENNFRHLFHENLPLWIFSDGLASNTAAYYQHQLNGLTISVGMLQPPIFSPDFSDALVYSRLGVFVAHEIAHSIDRTGRLFDADGAYVGGSEQSGLTTQEQCLVDRYTQQTALGNVHNGAQTLNENFADTLGMQIAYETFAAGATRTDEERRDFFRSFAQLFCHAQPTSAAQEQASIDTARHALPVLRVNNAVRSVYDYYEAWHCKNSDGDFCPFFVQE